MILKAISATATLLSAWISNPAPWYRIEANSDQRQPVYLGATPRELSLGLSSDGGDTALPTALRKRGESELLAIARLRGQTRLEVELWPARDDAGRLVWAYSRWRKAESRPWQWLDARSTRFTREPAPFLPAIYRPWVAADAKAVYDDFLLAPDLYAKPVFADCIWTDESGDGVFGAWYAPEQSADFREAASKFTAPGARPVCRVLPQPARVSGNPAVWTARVEAGKVHWPAAINWKDPAAELPSGANPAAEGAPRIAEWPADLVAAYQADVRVLAGEEEAVFPASGRRVRFERKNSADPNHQLEELVDYLEERYAALGLETRRVRFTWRGIAQSNLIAVIPGSAGDARQKPVLLADHIDTAYSEDLFDRGRGRISAPGADDNVTAVAGLLRAAAVLKNSAYRPSQDIWLVHLTGEEFPGDDLGARHLVSMYLTSKQDIRGLVLMDMIGYRKRGDATFQVNAGASPESRELARIALRAATTAAPGLTPTFRPRFDARSYLYNTDGLIFSEAGYPVILLNEHINHLENLERPHYHRSTDLSKTLDWDYALAIVRTAIETVARLAESP